LSPVGTPMRLASVPVSFMEIHTPVCFYGKEQIDAVQSKRCGGRENPPKSSIYIKMEKNTIRMEKW